MARPASVLVDGAEVFVRIYGFTDLGGRWADGEPPPAVPWIDQLMGHTKFAISRQAEAEYPATVLFEQDKKVSRPHAEVSYSESDSAWTLTCLGKNGLDLDGEHVEQGVSRRLASKARVRCGDSYFYVLLPKRGPANAGPTDPAPAAASRAASVPAARVPQKGKVLVPYETMLTKIYEKYYAPYGYCFTADVARQALLEFPDANLGADDTIRKGLNGAFHKHPDKWAQVDAADVPPAILRELSKSHARRGGSWWHRLGSVPTFVPTVAAAGGGGGAAPQPLGAPVRSNSAGSSSGGHSLPAAAAAQPPALAGAPPTLPPPQDSAAMTDDASGVHEAQPTVPPPPPVAAALPLLEAAPAGGSGDARMHDGDRDASQLRFSESQQ